MYPDIDTFLNVFSTDIQFSYEGYSHAERLIRKNHRFPPTVVWVSDAEDNEYGGVQWVHFVRECCASKGIHLPELEIRTTPHFSAGQWSLGNDKEYGFGSRYD